MTGYAGHFANFAGKAFRKSPQIPTANLGIADAEYKAPLQKQNITMALASRAITKTVTDYHDVQFEVKNKPVTRADFPQDFSTVWGF